MATSNHRMLMAIGSGALVMATLQGCTATLHPTPSPDPDHGHLIVPPIPGTAAWKTQQRRAEDGGLVTVDYYVVPGAMPSENMGPGPAILVAWFSNRGERGKKEKRYGWKPRRQAEYELVLSHDGSGKTKWEMREHGLAGGRPYSVGVRSGHLLRCTGPDHPPDKTYRDVDFKACQPGIPYDRAEIASGIQGSMVRFATNSMDGDGRFLQYDSPGWITCDGGCCTFAQ